MINTTSNWLRFGAFLSLSGPSLRIHWLLTTVHVPLAAILSLHALRPTSSSAGTSGVRSCANSPPLATTCHRPLNSQRPNRARSQRAALYFSMSPNQAISAENSISSPPTRAAQPLTILSRPKAVDASGFRRDCRSVLGRNACPLSLLGQDDSCVLVGMADAPFPRNPRPRSPDADRQPPHQGCVAAGQAAAEDAAHADAG
jgi:hypothetical protein